MMICQFIMGMYVDMVQMLIYGHDNVCQHNSNVDMIVLAVNDGIK
jgi:hypothetical protein